MTAPFVGDPEIGREVACVGKRRYNSRREARAHRNRLKGGGPLNIYLCPFCGCYHLGHMPRDIRRGKTGKDNWRRRRGIA